MTNDRAPSAACRPRRTTQPQVGRAVRVISDCRFRKTGAEYDRKRGIKWLSSTELWRSDITLRATRPPLSAPPCGELEHLDQGIGLPATASATAPSGSRGLPARSGPRPRPAPPPPRAAGRRLVQGKRGRVTISHSKQWAKEAAEGASFSTRKRGRVTIAHTKQWPQRVAGRRSVG